MSAAERSPDQPTTSPARITLCDGITLTAPVVQAPLGPAGGPALAAAVSRAGALGCLTVHDEAPESLRRRLTQIRQLTKRPVLLAFTAPYETEALLDVAIEKDFRHILAFWWNGPRLSRWVHNADGVVFRQVGTSGQGSDALDEGADVLVAQGTKAGGPVRTPYPMPELIDTLRSLSPNTPIAAGGGLADREDVAETLRLGANVALLGTRFLLTDEAELPLEDKARLVRCTSVDLVLDNNAEMDWPCAPCRGLPQSGAKSGLLFAGCGLSRMNSILPAAELVSSLKPPL